MTNSKEETSLIRNVVANPDADEPRLKYAEWLESQGRLPRARLIRAQCQIEHLNAEVKGLLEQYEKEWIGELSTVSKY